MKRFTVIVVLCLMTLSCNRDVGDKTPQRISDGNELNIDDIRWIKDITERKLQDISKKYYGKSVMITRFIIRTNGDDLDTASLLNTCLSTLMANGVKVYDAGFPNWIDNNKQTSDVPDYFLSGEINLQMFRGKESSTKCYTVTWKIVDGKKEVGDLIIMEIEKRGKEEKRKF